ncbi:MAG: electron transport complex subunit RsxG [Gammaproteobacteria bacterium]|nr:MAG: electron transport complex subunit RsxG [Gammaproteobacteria bacterium]
MKLSSAISRNALLLGAFATVCTLLITLTWLGTHDHIAAAELQVRRQALLDLIPKGEHANDMLQDTLPAAADGSLLKLKQNRDIYRARNAQGQVIAVILPVRAPDGYSGDINALVAIAADLTVLGVKVISHRETPGLGDKIDTRKSSWIGQFTGKNPNNPAPTQWAVQKDGGSFDQLTGATISSRAVVNAVRDALQYASDNYPSLFAQGDTANVSH